MIIPVVEKVSLKVATIVPPCFTFEHIGPCVRGGNWYWAPKDIDASFGTEIGGRAIENNDWLIPSLVTGVIDLVHACMANDEDTVLYTDHAIQLNGTSTRLAS